MRALAFLLAVMLMIGAAMADDESSPTPQRRLAPEYPVACMPPDGEYASPQTVTVGYDVTRKGLVENVRILDSTNTCFHAVSVATVRGWLYQEGIAKSDLETTFTFVFEEETQAIDFDVRVLYREPPQYPNRCENRADDRERVVVEFAISVEGIPEDIHVVESTNSCFEHAAVRSIENWRYRPKLIDGEPARREGVITQITFVLAGRLPPKLEMRRSVYSKLRRAERLLNRGDHDKALVILNELEARYGDDFSQKELSNFLRLRAGVKIAMNDYSGALDDLRVVQNIGLGQEANEAVGNMILQLEAIIAQQDSSVADEKENEIVAEEQ